MYCLSTTTITEFVCKHFHFLSLSGNSILIIHRCTINLQMSFVFNQHKYWLGKNRPHLSQIANVLSLFAVKIKHLWHHFSYTSIARNAISARTHVSIEPFDQLIFHLADFWKSLSQLQNEWEKSRPAKKNRGRIKRDLFAAMGISQNTS